MRAAAWDAALEASTALHQQTSHGNSRSAQKNPQDAAHRDGGRVPCAIPPVEVVHPQEQAVVHDFHPLQQLAVTFQLCHQALVAGRIQLQLQVHVQVLQRGMDAENNTLAASQAYLPLSLMAGST